MRQHHPTGALGATHLDPGLVFSVSTDEHDDEHVVRRSLGLDQGARASTEIARVELRLRRLAVFLGKTFAPRISDESLRSFVVLLAEHVVVWADALVEARVGEARREADER